MKTPAKTKASLLGEVILITGAGSGIGLALARSLRKSGATIYPCDLEGEDLQSLSEGCSETVHPTVLDITDRLAFIRVVDEIIAKEGKIDGLINAAGITVIGKAADIRVKHWHEVLGVNVTGTVNAIELIYPTMVARGSGKILNMGSIIAETGEVGAAPFATSKGFILGLHRSLQAEASHHGVSVTLALPGYFPPDLLQRKRIVTGDPATVTRAHSLCQSSALMVADVILKGLCRGKKNIFYPPFKARYYWLLAHWFPFLLTPLQKRFLKGFEVNREP